MLTVIPNEKGPRAYLFGRRVHHGLVGIILTVVGGILVFHDRKDFPFLADNK